MGRLTRHIWRNAVFSGEAGDRVKDILTDGAWSKEHNIQRIDLPKRCDKTTGKSHGGRDDCKHNFPPESETIDDRKSRTCWRCTKCGRNRCYSHLDKRIKYGKRKEEAAEEWKKYTDETEQILEGIRSRHQGIRDRHKEEGGVLRLFDEVSRRFGHRRFLGTPHSVLSSRKYVEKVIADSGGYEEALGEVSESIQASAPGEENTKLIEVREALKGYTK